MMSKNVNDIGTLHIRGVDHCRSFNGISKSEAVNLVRYKIKFSFIVCNR